MNSTGIAIPSRPRLLIAARVLFLVYSVTKLLIYLASLPSYFQRATTGTVPDIFFKLYQPSGNEYFASQAEMAGLSLYSWLIASTLVSFFVLGVHAFVSGLIFWRLPQSGFALFSAYVIMLTGTAVTHDAVLASALTGQLGSGLLLLINLGALVWPLLPPWLYLFPDGRAVPRWARWPIGISMTVFMVFMIVGVLDSSRLISPEQTQGLLRLTLGTDLLVVLVVPALLLGLASQLYRYWRVSGPVERQQTKWFLFGLGLLLLVFLIGNLPQVARLEAVSSSIFITILPITIGIALLRYRLWDVDVIVRKTTTYAILSGLVILIYLGSVVVLQRILSPVTGESTVAVVLSTLLIAALFLPLRSRVQSIIDRRFFRKKYDAEQVLAQFAATVRDETDLDELTAELARVIQETMQPQFVTVWLAPVVGDEKAGTLAQNRGT